jgi:tetratricopeptide (TPR) repeat protein
VALANTLLNKTHLVSYYDHEAELEPVFRRIVQLDRDAVEAAPGTANFKAELALVLVGQGMFFLDTGRPSDAEKALREALTIHQSLLDDGHLKGYVERYVARSFAGLGRVLAAAGQAEEAEHSYREAVNLLDRSSRDFPESVYYQQELARTLTGLADLLKDPPRRIEALETGRRVRHIYEALRANAPENPAVNNELAWFLATNPEPGLRDSAQAVKLATKAVTALSESANYRNTLGVAHYRNGDYRLAIVELEMAMSLREGGTCADWFFLAMAHRQLGEGEKAQAWFHRAVEWMDKHEPYDADLQRFRAEAKEVLAEAGKH